MSKRVFRPALVAVSLLISGAIAATTGAAPAGAVTPARARHATWYVAVSGADGGCAGNSAASPFATVQAAVQCAGDGDVIMLAPSGTHPYPGVGPVQHSVTIQAQPGATARTVRIDVSQPTDTGAGGGELVVAAGASVQVRGVTLDCVAHNCLHSNITNHGTLSLTRSTVTGAGYAVAIANQSSATDTARLTVLSSTIADNTNLLGFYASQGAGIASTGGGAAHQPTLTVVNSTIADNSNQASTIGGGIYTDASATGAVTLINDTITGNEVQSAAGTGAGVSDLVGLEGTATPVVLSNTIIAGNTAAEHPDVQGTLHDGPGGHNLIGDPTGSSGLTNAVNGDLVGIANPGLNPLANNQGTTKSVALRPHSPAIGAGDPTTCQGPNVVNLDQRLHPRHADTRDVCDIGAYDTGATA